MAAKDVLDIQVSVDDLDAAVVVFDGAALRALGFERRPYDHDHAPALDDDPEMWAKRYWSCHAHPGGDVSPPCSSRGFAERAPGVAVP